MLKANKEPSKAELKEKVRAWKVIYAVMCNDLDELTKDLIDLREEKLKRIEELKEKLSKAEDSNINSIEESAELCIAQGYQEAIRNVLYRLSLICVKKEN